MNYEKKVDAKGNVTMTPLSADKLAQVQQLVKDAMGFDDKRGDSVNVVNSTFTSDLNTTPAVPWWRPPESIGMGIQGAKYLGIGIVALFLYFSMVKPAMKRAFPPLPEPVASTLLPAGRAGLPRQPQGRGEGRRRQGCRGESPRQYGKQQGQIRSQSRLRTQRRASGRENRCDGREELGVR